MSQSPFTVENLTPQSPTGAPQGTYELRAASVSPQRIIGRGPLGPIEETVPTTHWANFLTKDGCINKVPLRTGSVFSMQAEARSYEDETTSELVNSGWIPANECPYALSAILRGPYITPPPGVKACNGSGHTESGPGPDGHYDYGCEHLKEVGAVRRASVLAKYNEDAAKQAAMKQDDITLFMQQLSAGLAVTVDAAIARGQQPSGPGADRKQMAKSVKGESE